MEVAGLSDIKKELQLLPANELLDLCIQLARYKKENKEFLGYLLFEAGNKEVYMQSIRAEIDEHINSLTLQKNLYLFKKSLRKLLRILSKYSKFMSDKAKDAEMYIYLCQSLNQSGIDYRRSTQLLNIYNQLIKKIETQVAGLHEDLQHDFEADIEKLKKS